MISEVIDRVLLEVKSIDKLYAPSEDAADNLTAILKSMYDSSVLISRKKIGPLDKLTVTGLDDETIWEEIQTRNKPLLRYLTKLVARLKKRVEANQNNSSDSEGDEEMEVVEEEFENDGVDEDNVEEEGEQEEDEEEIENSEDDEGGAMDSEEDEGDFDESKDDFVDSVGSNEVANSDDGDDDGDSEDDMEAWLDREDELEMNREEREERRSRKADKRKSVGSDEDSDDELEEDDELAFVQQHLYEGEDGSDDEAGNADYKFSDFFVADKSERRLKARAAGNTGIKNTKKRTEVKRSQWSEEEDSEQSGEDIEEDGEEDEEDEGIEEEDEEEDDDEENGSDDGEAVRSVVQSVAKTGRVTATQQRNQALSSQIADLEDELMGAKPWELRGEVKASDRPENSFLELHADIERTSKPAPVVTQAFTSSMEDMIRRRIKEGNFNDVLPPKEVKGLSGDEATGEMDLSQEKNKQGLGEVYAEEFLAKSLNAQPEAVSKRLEQDRLDAQEIFHKISRELDALSHFHYTPRPVVADSKIRTLQPSANALSSLQLEDVTPLTSAQASTSQLAPEQVFEKKHGKQASLMAEEEMTSDDRKRARRASKAANKAKKTRAEDEKMLTGAKEGPGSARDKVREENKAIDEELKRDSRVLLTTPGPAGASNKKAKITTAAQETTAYSKSSSFFSRLQQETADQIKKKGSAKAGKSVVANPFTMSSNAVKL